MADIALAVLVTIDAEDHVEHLRLPPSVAASVVAAERGRRAAEPERGGLSHAEISRDTFPSPGAAGSLSGPRNPGEALGALSEAQEEAG